MRAQFLGGPAHGQSMEFPEFLPVLKYAQSTFDTFTLLDGKAKAHNLSYKIHLYKWRREFGRDDDAGPRDYGYAVPVQYDYIGVEGEPNPSSSLNPASQHQASH